MTPIVQVALPPMEVTSVAQSPAVRARRKPVTPAGAMAIDRALVLLRRSVADCGYTLDALEAATGKGRAHIHRVLQGDRPLTLQFLTALPPDVKARFAQLSAEAMGFIVVTPLQGQEAVKGFVGGLLGILAKGAA